jgi:hypothetical protein
MLPQLPRLVHSALERQSRPYDPAADAPWLEPLLEDQRRTRNQVRWLLLAIFTLLGLEFAQLAGWLH